MGQSSDFVIFEHLFRETGFYMTEIFVFNG